LFLSHVFFYLIYFNRHSFDTVYQLGPWTFGFGELDPSGQNFANCLYPNLKLMILSNLYHLIWNWFCLYNLFSFISWWLFCFCSLMINYDIDKTLPARLHIYLSLWLPFRHNISTLSYILINSSLCLKNKWFDLILKTYCNSGSWLIALFKIWPSVWPWPVESKVIKLLYLFSFYQYILKLLTKLIKPF